MYYLQDININLNVLFKKNRKKLLVDKGFFLLAHSYIINRTAAKSVIDYYNKYYTRHKSHLDVLLNILDLKIVGLSKRFCIQRISKSDNKWIKGLNAENISTTTNFEKNQIKNGSPYKMGFILVDLLAYTIIKYYKFKLELLKKNIHI